MEKSNISYFLGANSPEGFVSLFSELYTTDGSWRCFILKGGPGTGKSTLMKRIASLLNAEGYNVDRIYCSSDPDSLDAVKCESLGFCIADGTSPHVIEPVFPGAVENIVNLGEYWESDRLIDEGEKIIAMALKNSSLHTRCTKFIKAASLVLSDTVRLGENSVNKDKINSYALRLSKRLFKNKKGKTGSEKKVFLSALTPKGVFFHNETVKALASQIIFVDDKANLVTGYLMEKIRTLALENGYDVISAFCPLNPNGKPEHIIIPECSLAFIRKHSAYPEIKGTRTVHAGRFIDTQELSRHRQKIDFNNQISSELLKEAISSLKQAKKIHDELEALYIPAMDFSGYDILAREIVNRALKK